MKKQLWITVKQFLLYVLLTMGMMILGLMVVVAQVATMGIEKDKEAILKFASESSIAQWAFALGLFLAIIIFLGKRYVRISTGRIARGKLGKAAFMAILISLGCMFAEIVLIYEFFQFFPDDTESAEIGGKTFDMLSAITVSILAPIAEEIGFRGVLMGGLLRMRCKPWVAIVLSAIVFGLFHGVGVHGVGSMVFGIIVGWLYWRTRSLIPGMIAHVVNNSVVTTFEFLPSDYEPSQTVLVIIFVVSLLLLLIGLRWYKQGRYLSRS